MSKVYCLKHPKYDGKENPELNCASCCSIFVNRIKTINAKRAETVAAWLESKSKLNKSAAHS